MGRFDFFSDSRYQWWTICSTHRLGRSAPILAFASAAMNCGFMPLKGSGVSFLRKGPSLIHTPVLCCRNASQALAVLSSYRLGDHEVKHFHP